MLVIVIGLLGLLAGIITLVVIALVSPFLIFAYKRHQASAATTSGSGSTAAPAGKAKPSNWGKALLGFGLIGLLLFQVFTWSYNEVYKPIKPVAKHYVLKWQKGPADPGRNPDYRSTENSDPILVDIQENSKGYFRFVAHYKYHDQPKVAQFFWDKSLRYGTWSQDESGESKDGGQWYLYPDSKVPDRFIGGQTDKVSPNWKTMQLELEEQ